MKLNKFFIYLSFTFLTLFVLDSCYSIPSSANVTGPRTIILNDVIISETETDNGFTSWYCVDYVFEGAVLVEVGYFDLKGQRFGFVLFDGGYTGVLSHFSRQGLDYRWDWGDNGEYAIVIEPDGSGLYYDFSMSKDGTAKPRGVYKAYKRK